LSDSFSIQDGLDVLSSWLFNFALEYAIRTVKENQAVLKLNETHQLLDNADDFNLLGDKIDVLNKSTESLIYSNKELCKRKLNICCWLVTRQLV
jgi:hypothetical protein